MCFFKQQTPLGGPPHLVQKRLYKAGLAIVCRGYPALECACLNLFEPSGQIDLPIK